MKFWNFLPEKNNTVGIFILLRFEQNSYKILKFNRKSEFSIFFCGKFYCYLERWDINFDRDINFA